MLVATMASHLLPTTRIKLASPSPNPNPILSAPSSVRAPLSTSFLSFSMDGSVSGDFSGSKIRPASLNPYSSGSRGKRGVVTMAVLLKLIGVSGSQKELNLRISICDPYQELRHYTLGYSFLKRYCLGATSSDLASYLYKNRIVYLGMPLVPSVTELMVAEFLYLQYEDDKKPVYLYINSTGTTKGGVKLGYETEAFAIYDIMRFVKLPIFTLCVGNAWAEAAMILAAGTKGNRAALPSSTIMIKQPIAKFQGQASDVEIMRKEIKNVKADLVKLYSRHIGKSPKQIEEDIRRPKYFSPSEAIEYGIIDKVLYSERCPKDTGFSSEQKKSNVI